MFAGILIEKNGDNYSARLKQTDEKQLPDGDVIVRVACSTLNYKDALALTGKSPIVRSFPVISGIDLAGTVETSSHPS